MCNFHNFKSSFNNFCSTTYYFSISNNEYLKEDFALKKNHLTFVPPQQLMKINLRLICLKNHLIFLTRIVISTSIEIKRIRFRFDTKKIISIIIRNFKVISLISPIQSQKYILLIQYSNLVSISGLVDEPPPYVYINKHLLVVLWFCCKLQSVHFFMYTLSMTD